MHIRGMYVGQHTGIAVFGAQEWRGDVEGVRQVLAIAHPESRAVEVHQAPLYV